MWVRAWWINDIYTNKYSSSECVKCKPCWIPSLVPEHCFWRVRWLALSVCLSHSTDLLWCRTWTKVERRKECKDEWFDVEIKGEEWKEKEKNQLKEKVRGEQLWTLNILGFGSSNQCVQNKLGCVWKHSAGSHSKQNHLLLSDSARSPHLQLAYLDWHLHPSTKSQARIKTNQAWRYKSDISMDGAKQALLQLLSKKTSGIADSVFQVFCVVALQIPWTKYRN